MWAPACGFDVEEPDAARTLVSAVVFESEREERHDQVTSRQRGFNRDATVLNTNPLVKAPGG